MTRTSYASFIIIFTGLFVSFLKLSPVNPNLVFVAYLPIVLFALIKPTITLKEISIYTIIIICVLKIMSGLSFQVIEALKQAFFMIIAISILNKISFESMISEAKLILFFSSILAFIGIFQFFGLEPFIDFKPLPNTDFKASGGFAGITLVRSNFALGNSINAGTFFVLNFFILISIWNNLSLLVKTVLPTLFLVCIVCTLSRSAFLGILLILPFCIQKIGFTKIIIPILGMLWLGYDWHILLSLRFFDKSYTIGSNNNRADFMQNFYENFQVTGILFGDLGYSGSKITDGWIFYNFLGVGVIFTLVFIYCMIFPAKLKIINVLQYFSLLLFLILILIVNNSIHAFYNIWLLIFSFRLSQCTKQNQYFSQSSMEKNF